MPENIASLVNEAQEKFNGGDFNKCEKILLTVLSNASTHYADIYNKLGYIACNNNRLKEAVAHFIRAIEINPAYTEASLNLAVTYNELGEFDKAQDVFNEAIKPVHEQQQQKLKVDPFILGKLANEHMIMGDKYFSLHMIDNALEEYRKALSMRPRFADIVNKLGIALKEKGELDDAIRIFMKAISINSHYFSAHIQLGITYYMKGFLDLAIEAWEKAADIDPSSKEARLYLSIARKGQ